MTALVVAGIGMVSGALALLLVAFAARWLGGRARTQEEREI